LLCSLPSPLLLNGYSAVFSLLADQLLAPNAQVNDDNKRGGGWSKMGHRSVSSLFTPCVPPMDRAASLTFSFSALLMTVVRRSNHASLLVSSQIPRPLCLPATFFFFSLGVLVQVKLLSDGNTRKLVSGCEFGPSQRHAPGQGEQYQQSRLARLCQVSRGKKDMLCVTFMPLGESGKARVMSFGSAARTLVAITRLGASEWCGETAARGTFPMLGIGNTAFPSPLDSLN
jgi:hypothetical protein